MSHGIEMHEPISGDMPYMQCPPWFVYHPATNHYECYNNSSISHIVKCTEKGALLKLGYCMTYEKEKGTFLSQCNFNMMAEDHNITADEYIILPKNITELNEYMCAPLNSRGVGCSECLNGFGHSVVSREFRCSDCTNAWYGVPLYLFMEFVPITVFYFIILFFQISMTSAPMLAYVLYSQTVAF